MDLNQALIERAQHVIPGGVNSPVRAFGSVGGAPRFIERAKGPYMWDVTDKRFTDYVCSWATMIRKSLRRFMQQWIAAFLSALPRVLRLKSPK